jgi:hypothetical protein
MLLGTVQVLVRVRSIRSLPSLIDRAVALIALAACAAAVGCGSSSSGGSTHAKGARPGRVIDAGCSASRTRPRDPGTFVAGRVYFSGYVTPGWRQGDRLQKARAPHGRWFSKVALGIRGNRPVRLKVVGAAARRSVTLTRWTPRAGRDLTVTQSLPDPCADATWRLYPGGFVFRRPRCVTLRVTVEGHAATVPFGLGRSCN